MNIETKIIENVINGLNLAFTPGSIMKSMIANKDKLCLSDNDPHYMVALGVEGFRLALYGTAVYYTVKSLAKNLL